MLYTVELVSVIQQSGSAMFIHTLLFSGFPSHLGYDRALSRLTEMILILTEITALCVYMLLLN